MKEAFFLSLFEISLVFPWDSVLICQQALTTCAAGHAWPPVGLSEARLVVRLRQRDVDTGRKRPVQVSGQLGLPEVRGVREVFSLGHREGPWR